jgi:hypothetical protein
MTLTRERWEDHAHDFWFCLNSYVLFGLVWLDSLMPFSVKITVRFLITDVIVFENAYLLKTMPLSMRLKLCQDQILLPRQNPALTYQDTFRVRLKMFVSLPSASDTSHNNNGDALTSSDTTKSRLTALVKDVIPVLPHACCGITLVPNDLMRCSCIYEWVTENTEHFSSALEVAHALE